MNAFPLVWALAALVAAPPLMSQQAPAQQGTQTIRVQDGEIVPSTSLADQPFTAITDVDAHRGRQLPYVRTKADYVVCDLAEVDVNAEVLFEIDGEPIPRDEFRRRAIMYTGMNEIDKAITAAICSKQLAEIEAAGGDPDEFLIGDEEIDNRINAMKEMVKFRVAQTPGAPAGPNGESPEDFAVQQFEEAVELTIGMDAYRDRQRAEASFERIFLPMPSEATGEVIWDAGTQGPLPADDPKPDWMPQITWDALGGDEQSRQLRNYIKQSAARGTEIAQIFRGQLTSKIRLGVIDRMGLDYFFDADLPEGVFLRVGETDVMTDELYPLIAGMLSDTDVQLILRELLTLRAMKRELQENDAWLSDGEFDSAFAEEEALYKGTLLPLSSIVIFRGYYSVDRFREHYRYGEGYRRWKRATMTDEDVETHYTEGGRMLFERGLVELDMAYNRIDMEQAFGEDNFAQAEAALQKVLDESRFRVDMADGAMQHFATQAVMDEFLAGLSDDDRAGATVSEWPEGDFDAVVAAFPAPQRADPGDEGVWSFQRNPLRQFLTESELEIMLTGYSLSDDAFYKAEPGDVLPMHSMRCRRHYWGSDMSAGVWMVRVKDFSRGRQLPALQGEKLDQAKTDFLDLTYLYWSQECLEDILGDVSLSTE